MLLIQTMKWFGASRESTMDADQKRAMTRHGPESYATAMELPQALEALRAYDEEFRAHYRITAVEHTLIGVQAIPDLSADDLENARLWTVEDLLASVRNVVSEDAA